MGARLGDGVLDLAALATDGPLDEDPALFAQPSLNAFMAAGRATWARVREALRALATGPDAEPATVAARRRRAAAADRRRATTSTSTRRSITRRTSGGCSVPTPSRCRPTGATCRSAITVAPARWWSAARRSAARAGSAWSRAPTPRSSARARAWTSSSSWASWSACRAALGEPVADRSRARPRLRRAARQRLERARHPGLGVPPARPVPGQVVRHVGGRVGHAAGGDPRAPRRRAGRRSPRRCPTCARSRGRSTSTSRSSSTAPSSRARTRATCTGRRPSSSRT